MQKNLFESQSATNFYKIYRSISKGFSICMIKRQYIGGRKVVTSRSALAILELYCHDTIFNLPTIARYFFMATFFTRPRTGILNCRSYVYRRAGSTNPPVMSASWYYNILLHSCNCLKSASFRDFKSIVAQQTEQ